MTAQRVRSNLHSRRGTADRERRSATLLALTETSWCPTRPRCRRRSPSPCNCHCPRTYGYRRRNLEQSSPILTPGDADCRRAGIDGRTIAPINGVVVIFDHWVGVKFWETMLTTPAVPSGRRPFPAAAQDRLRSTGVIKQTRATIVRNRDGAAAATATGVGPSPPFPPTALKIPC